MKFIYHLTKFYKNAYDMSSEEDIGFYESYSDAASRKDIGEKQDGEHYEYFIYSRTIIPAVKEGK